MPKIVPSLYTGLGTITGNRSRIREKSESLGLRVDVDLDVVDEYRSIVGREQSRIVCVGPYYNVESLLSDPERRTLIDGSMASRDGR